MQIPDNRHHRRCHSDTEIISSGGGNGDGTSHTGPLKKRDGGKKSARDSVPTDTSTTGAALADDYVEITLDVREDTVELHSVKAGGGEQVKSPELSVLARNDSSKNRKVAEKLKRLAPFTRGHQSPGVLGRTKSAATQALKGLKFISKTNSSAAFADVEESVKAGGCEQVESPELTQLARNDSSKNRKVAEELKRLAPLARRHQPLGVLGRTKSAATQALKGLKFISKTNSSAAWADVEERFDELTSTTNGLLPSSLFYRCIGMGWNSEEFAVQLFDALARRRNILGDSITKVQLKDFWDQISDQNFDSRLQTFFDMLDKDADGRITEDEVKEIISSSASANQLWNIQMQADEYARLIMEELDPDECGYIMVENLETLLLQDPSQSIGWFDESQNLSKLLSQKLKPTQGHILKRWYRDLQYFLLDNWQRVWVMALWIAVMVALLAYKYVQYKNRAVFGVMGHCVCMAKGAAETLKLNMALILLPVCRNTITCLRNKTRLGVVVPFDDNLNFHKVIAVAIAIGVGIHGISHLACSFPRLLNTTLEKYKPMESFFGDQPKSYWHFLKGWQGITGIVMVVLMAIAFALASSSFRRNRVNLPKPLNKLTGFSAFWYSHHLFIIVYSLLIVHGVKLYLTHDWYKKTTWMYLAVPITLYVGERIIRAYRSSIMAIKILKAAIYPGAVLILHLSKPEGFKYKSGQYIFVNCPAVSPFEWHPFYITSAPMDDYISVHIRIVGDWTQQLKLVFAAPPVSTGMNGLFRDDYLVGALFLKLLIDGPYGTPTQDYMDYDIVLLIGIGIGATPMISVVKDIVNNIKAMEEEENALEEGANGPSPPSLMPKQKTRSGSSEHNFKIRRAYFYWVTREQGSFDWLMGVMNEVAKVSHEGVIEMHNYCTSVYEKEDARSTMIAMLQSINYAKNGVDVVSGTKIKSHFGKPNWRTVYKRIAVNHPNAKVGVFYSGPPALVKELKKLASDFSHKTCTKFEFHKENF